MCVNTRDTCKLNSPDVSYGCHYTCITLHLCTPVSFKFYTQSMSFLLHSFVSILTLSGLSLRDPLSDYPTGIIDGCGGLKLHRLHNVALANADFQRQHHHPGRRCGRQLQLHLRTTRGKEGKGESRRGWVHCMELEHSDGTHWQWWTSQMLEERNDSVTVRRQTLYTQSDAHLSCKDNCVFVC